MRISILLIAILSSIVFYSFNSSEKEKDWKNENVVDVLKKFGEDYPKHYIQPDSALIKKGEDLILKGRTINSRDKNSNYISKYFPCTSCHNLSQEDPDIRFSNPDTRLPYVKENGQKFLQGTTFWGIVNRESWYNDDYYKKYGDVVKAANDSLRLSIQLCAVECSQGRILERWEEDAILAYYWSKQLKISDLNFSKKDESTLKEAFYTGKIGTEFIQLLKSYYSLKAPAHFQTPIADKVKGYDFIGRPEVGKDIYELSCRNCHNEKGVSDYLLDYSKHTFKQLKKNMFKSTDMSFYHIIRKGTYATPGARPYMPHYPSEKMSDQQIEDLRAYILTKVNKK